jgi:serine phosphatase RsbU (regulator of sigma subunit)
MFQQAFHLGVLYELDHHGEITTRLFEQLNTRVGKASDKRNHAADIDLPKFITMLYGEISEKGLFRFINAGHPPPIIFSYQFGSV